MTGKQFAPIGIADTMQGPRCFFSVPVDDSRGDSKLTSLTNVDRGSPTEKKHRGTVWLLIKYILRQANGPCGFKVSLYSEEQFC